MSSCRLHYWQPVLSFLNGNLATSQRTILGGKCQMMPQEIPEQTLDSCQYARLNNSYSMKTSRLGTQSGAIIKRCDSHESGSLGRTPLLRLTGAGAHGTFWTFEDRLTSLAKVNDSHRIVNGPALNKNLGLAYHQWPVLAIERASGHSWGSSSPQSIPPDYSALYKWHILRLRGGYWPS